MLSSTISHAKKKWLRLYKKCSCSKLKLKKSVVPNYRNTNGKTFGVDTELIEARTKEKQTS